MIRFWTQARIRRVSLAVIATILLTVLWIFRHGIPNNESRARQGDLPAFYSAGMILRQGQPHQLYDYELQRKIQNQFWPKEMKGEFLPFAYPPYVALPLKALAHFTPKQAGLISFGFLSLCLIFAVLITAQFAPLLKKNPAATVAFFLAFSPILGSIACNQNSTLSMLLFAFAVWGLARRTPWGEIFCGISLGLWLFKPQYAAPLILFLAIAGYRRVALSALVCAGIYYLLAARLFGFDWPRAWVPIALKFSVGDFNENQHFMISLIGALKSIRPFVNWGAHEDRILDVLGYGSSLALFLWLALKFRATRWIADKIRREEVTENLLCLGGIATLLFSPHTVYYDFGICVIPLAKFMRLETDRAIHLFLILAIFFATLPFIVGDPPIHPFFFLTLGCFVFAQFRSK